MINELIFVFYILFVSGSAVFFLSRSLNALIALICVQYILMNLFVTKEIIIFGLAATATDALAVGTTLALNLLQEYGSKELAQKTIWISFFCSLFYIVLVILHLAYIPSSNDFSQVYFKALLSPMPRIILASLFVYLIVQHFDCIFYSYLSKRFSYKNFILRNYGSIALSQLIDTVLFSFLGLYGISESYSSLSIIIQIIIVSYIVKLVAIIIAVPYLTLVKKFYYKNNNL
jgi:queuosine precursor transporter